MRRTLIWLTPIFLIVLWLAASFYSYSHPLGYAAQTVIIPPHSGGRATLGKLHEAGLVPNNVLLAVPLVTSGALGKLKAGEYAFAPGLSPAEIIGRIARGEIVVHKVSIPEGWNSFQVMAALNNEPLLTGPAITTLPEGSVLPDTYRFTRDEPRLNVLTRMQQAKNELLATLWPNRAPGIPVTTPEQAMVLASIIERETGVGEERPLVAGVFTNRLRLNMPLQTDPTVAYAILLARHGVPMEHGLTVADLKTDTVYNSYTRTGLPPTPICSPGKQAIEAALHPAVTNALYFVATGHGGHHFAATLEEHSRNVDLYRKSQHP